MCNAAWRVCDRDCCYLEEGRHTHLQHKGGEMAADKAMGRKICTCAVHVKCTCSTCRTQHKGAISTCQITAQHQPPTTNNCQVLMG